MFGVLTAKIATWPYVGGAFRALYFMCKDALFVLLNTRRNQHPHWHYLLERGSTFMSKTAYPISKRNYLPPSILGSILASMFIFVSAQILNRIYLALFKISMIVRHFYYLSFVSTISVYFYDVFDASIYLKPLSTILTNLF